MQNLIKNASALAKRKIERSARRVRPSYPVSGAPVKLNRDECGVNKQRLTWQDVEKKVKPIVLVGQFVFFRAINRPSRSKYAPHVGIKQDARLLKTLGLVA